MEVFVFYAKSVYSPAYRGRSYDFHVLGKPPSSSWSRYALLTPDSPELALVDELQDRTFRLRYHRLESCTMYEELALFGRAIVWTEQCNQCEPDWMIYSDVVPLDEENVAALHDTVSGWVIPPLAEMVLEYMYDLAPGDDDDSESDEDESRDQESPRVPLILDCVSSVCYFARDGR